VFDKQTGEVIIKVVNTSKQAQSVTMQLQGIKGEPLVDIITLNHKGSMDDENTLDNPERITPKNGTLKVDAGKGATLLLDDIPAMSFRLYKVKK
jgi:alpha-L-arabinofuranosidase